MSGTDVAELAFRFDSSDAPRATRDLQGVERQSERTERSAERLGKEADETGRKLRNMGSAVAFLDGPLGGVASRFRSLGTLIGQVGVAAAGALVLFGSLSLAARHLGSGVDAAVQLDSRIGELSTLLPGAADQVDEMTEAGRRMGVQFGTGTQAQIEAYYAAVSAGATNAAEATARVEAANRLAIGGAANLEGAVSILNASVNAYAASGLTAADASDVLFTGVRTGVTTIDELAAGLGRAIPIASSLGIGFDELVGGVAALTTQGQNTNLAVTGLRAALNATLQPSQQAAELAEQLGISFNSATVQSMGFLNFMQMVAERTGGDQQALTTLFGSIEAGTAVLSLAGEGGTRFAQIMAEMADRAGATQQAMDQMSNRISEGYGRVLAFVGQKQEEVGNAMLHLFVPAAETVIATMTGAEGASETLEAVFKVLAVTVGVLMVRSLAMMTVSIATTTVTAITGSAAFQAYALSVSLVGPVSATATVATTALGAAIRFALGPVGLMITAIGLISGAWLLHDERLRTVRESYVELNASIDRAEVTLQRWFDATESERTSLEQSNRALLANAEARLANASAILEQKRALYQNLGGGAPGPQRAIAFFVTGIDAALEDVRLATEAVERARSSLTTIDNARGEVLSNIGQNLEHLRSLQTDIVNLTDQELRQRRAILMERESQLRTDIAGALFQDAILEGLEIELSRVEEVMGAIDSALQSRGRRAATQASEDYENVIESLTRSIALLRIARGEERAVAEQFIAAGLAADATGEQADRIRELVGTYRQLQMDERIADLREEAATISMTSREVELYRMALEGATPQQLLMADAILRTTEEWEKQQDIMAAAAETVSRLTDQNMTALQRYQVEIRTLNEALNSGLDHEVYARAVERAQDAFVKADERLSTLRSTASGFLRDIRNGTSLLDAFANALNSMLDRAAESSLDALFRRFAPDLAGEAADMGVEAAKGQAHGAASGLAIGTAMVGAAQASALQIAGAMTTAGGLVAAQIASAMALSSLGGPGGLTTLGQGVLSFIGFGGFFADGGDLAAGQWGIVGERGPERIDARPGGGARITPLSQGRDSSGGLTVNIGQINAGGLSKEEAKEMVREGSRQAVKKATENAAGMVGSLAAGTQRPKMNG
ncbi:MULTISPECIES: phage tail tape measure protein [Hyphobacterium]|uniref:Phage tail tape measure protein n=1 Tax=Hyphobacterium vulgare TaxID=1736751 RepID=A0ABV6ZU87_9PROT